MREGAQGKGRSPQSVGSGVRAPNQPPSVVGEAISLYPAGMSPYAPFNPSGPGSYIGGNTMASKPAMKIEGKFPRGGQGMGGLREFEGRNPVTKPQGQGMGGLREFEGSRQTPSKMGTGKFGEGYGVLQRQYQPKQSDPFLGMEHLSPTGKATGGMGGTPTTIAPKTTPTTITPKGTPAPVTTGKPSSIFGNISRAIQRQGLGAGGGAKAVPQATGKVTAAPPAARGKITAKTPKHTQHCLLYTSPSPRD